MDLKADLCNGCGLCVVNCLLGVVAVVDGVAAFADGCSRCGACIRACARGAISMPAPAAGDGRVRCEACPVQCRIANGYYGACRRYVNRDGVLVRERPLVVPERGAPRVPLSPLLTGVGAGTTYPDCRPAPFIVSDWVDGVEVVTVVTEAPLSYSAMEVKIDTNRHVGAEGAGVRRDGFLVGRVGTEQYGAKVLSLGGVNLLTGKNGMVVATTMARLAGGEGVSLQVEGGSSLELVLGQPPVVDGVREGRMRVGCGSATVGMFAAQLGQVVDEAVILDHHIVGLLTEHLAGCTLGLAYSGVLPWGRKSTAGRYFGRAGNGWGGTAVTDPRQAIRSVDMKVARPGMRILVTETTGERAALFRLLPDGELEEVPVPPEVQAVVDIIASTWEEARVSALFLGGTGGSARAGVARFPLLLTRAIHEGRVTLTVGGAPVYLLPGGGINFLVDVEKVIPGSFGVVPTPAMVVPVEYTMTREVFEEIGGHVQAIRPLREALAGGAGMAGG